MIAVGTFGAFGWPKVTIWADSGPVILLAWGNEAHTDGPAPVSIG